MEQPSTEPNLYDTVLVARDTHADGHGDGDGDCDGDGDDGDDDDVP